MSTTELIAAYELVRAIRDKFPSGGVSRGRQRNRDHAVAYLDRDPFDIVLQVCVGPRGGIGGHAYLVNRRITPITDAIQVAALDDTSRDDLCPLRCLCWSDDGNTQVRPSAAQLADFLAKCLQSIPADAAWLDWRFRDPAICCPAESVSTLSGGATGLHR